MTQSPRQWEPPLKMSPHRILVWQIAALFSVLLGELGEGCSKWTLPSLQVHVLLCTIINLKLSPRKSTSFNLPIAKWPEHSSKALLTQPEVTDGVWTDFQSCRPSKGKARLCPQTTPCTHPLCLFCEVLSSSCTWLLHATPSYWTVHTGLEFSEHSS